MAARTPSARPLAGTAEVVIFTKAPVPGRTKTRLAPALGLDGAARLHRAFVDHTLARVAATGLPHRVALGADEDGRFAAELRARGLDCRPQCGGDLGARMAHELRGPGRRIAVGTDCPLLRPAWLLAAAQATAPIALGPAEDGGYWCVSVDGEAPQALFTAAFSDIPWSTAAVLSTTLSRCRAAGISPALLPTAWDVDEPAELDRLQAHPDCPPTLRALLTTLRPS